MGKNSALRLNDEVYHVYNRDLDRAMVLSTNDEKTLFAELISKKQEPLSLFKKGYKMGLELSIESKNKKSGNFAYTLPLSSDFIEFLGKQSSEKQQIFEKAFPSEELGESASVKGKTLVLALETILFLIETDNKLYNYSFVPPGDRYGVHLLSGQINNNFVLLQSGFEKCSMLVNARVDELQNIVYDEIIDLSPQKELQTDNGVIKILKKKARKILDITSLKQLILELKKYSPNDDFTVVIG